MFKIPFKWLPASWGLKGKAFSTAEAYYLYKGETLDRKLLDIEFDGTPPEEKVLQLDKKYGRLTEYDYEIEAINTREDLDLENRSILVLEAKRKHKKITDFEYKKETATILKKPWIDIKDHGFNPEESLNGLFFEFDWNEYWIEELRNHGYNGASEEEIVEQWFTDVCNSHVQTVVDGE